MATLFPGSIDSFTSYTDNVTVIYAADMNKVREALIQLENQLVGKLHANVKEYGAVGDGTTDDTAAIQAAVDAVEAGGGGTVFVPQGTYKLSATITIGSHVYFRGVGRNAVTFVHSSAFSGFAFELYDVNGASDRNVFGQSHFQILEGFTIEDRNSADTLETPTGRTEAHEGIYLHDIDWAFVRDVFVRDLKGRSLHLGNEVRECAFDNFHSFNCGDSATTKAAVTLDTDTGDANNTIYFFRSRIIYPDYYAVHIYGDLPSRLVYFTNSQIEGGGGGTGSPGYGDARPYHLFHVERCRSLYLLQCNLTNPGQDKACVNLEGMSGSPVGTASFVQCYMGDYSGTTTGGQGIRVNYATNVIVNGCEFSNCPDGDIDVTSVGGQTVYVSPDVLFSGTGFVGSYVGKVSGRINSSDFRFDGRNMYVDSLSMTAARTKLGFRGDSDTGRYKLGSYAVDGTQNAMTAIITPYKEDGNLPTTGTLLRFGGHGDYESSKVIVQASGGLAMLRGAGAPSDSGLGLTGLAVDGLTYWDSTNSMIWVRESGNWIAQTPAFINRVGQSAWSNTASETTIYTRSIGANLLGSDRMLRLTWFGDIMNNTASTTPAGTFKVKFGATTLYNDTTVALPVGGTTRMPIMFQVLLANLSTSSQVMNGTMMLGTGGGATTGIGNIGDDETHSTATFIGSSAIDTTSSADFAVTWQWNTLNGDLEFRRLYAILELV